MSQSTLGKYDSEFCGSLPIHLINVVQPYGALAVIDRESKGIVQVSENIDQVFGVDPTQLVNRSVADFISPQSMQSMEQKLAAPLNESIPMVWEVGGQRFLVIAHVKEDFYMIEINLDSSSELNVGSFVDVYQELKYAMSAIEGCSTIQDAARTAARELKQASGFDKVMIYQFDSEWNGHVLSEEMEEGMESYFGFTFPASDIPKQARDLYLRNPYRFIPDREYQPVKLYPVINPRTQSFMDLSDCNVRGVSKVHLEYLKNMGVTASMSTRILRDGKLWGLIACHHRVAMTYSYKMCSIFELLSNVISSKISSLENEEHHLLDSALQVQYTNLVEESYRLNDIRQSFFHGDSSILKAFDATGAALFYDGQVDMVGELPERYVLDELVLWLHTRDIRKVFATDHLPEQYDQMSDAAEHASGLLVIPINAKQDEYLLLFRPEVIRVINWGGDPDTRINFEKDMKTYHPRYSFKLWQEKVRGVSKPWKAAELQMAENLRNFLFEFLNANRF